MINTRMGEARMNELYAFLENKFDQLKESFIGDIKGELKIEISKFMKDQNEKITKLESEVSLLQKHVQFLKQANETCALNHDEIEQYGRRQCLRLEGVPVKENESPSDVLNFVKSCAKEADVEIPDIAFDRAHRIGKKYKDRNSGEEVQSIIARFVSFRYRTLFYRNRKEIINKARVRLDLTRHRYGILSDAIKFVEGHKDKVKFVYSDVNCRLKVHDVSGKEQFFDSVVKLRDIVEQL